MKQNADKAFQMSVLSSVYITLPTNYIYSAINKKTCLSCIRLSNEPYVDLFKLVETGLSLVCCLVIRGSVGDFLLLRYFNGIVLQPGVLRVSQYVSVESSSLIHHRPYS